MIVAIISKPNTSIIVFENHNHENIQSASLEVSKLLQSIIRVTLKIKAK